MSKSKAAYSKKTMRSFFTDLFVIALLAAVQIVLICMSVWRLYTTIYYIQIACRVISAFVILHIINKHESASYKLAWTVPILLFPAFGGILYVFMQGRPNIFRFKRRIETVDAQIKDALFSQEDAYTSLKKEYPEHASVSRYLRRSGFPVYANTKATYYSCGEDFYSALLEQLKKAEKYIFLEFFIVHEGRMWDGLLDILKQKAQQGVDIRVIYDGMGSITTLPRKYSQTLASYGIKAREFNRFVPVISTMQNNRDHRKIVVIDGRVAFTGGVNLSDEYINLVERFGRWKDAGIMIDGDAAVGYTMMFLRNWNLFVKQPENPNRFLRSVQPQNTENGYFLPYCDSPFDDEQTARNVYLNLINRANRSIYIMTPYLILDEELDSALRLAAHSGIDVRIITPHHADKKYVHLLTRSSYTSLIASGVKIYEYEPGFLHSKNLLVDGECAVVGSVNFDYRSLYLHFECAQLFIDRTAVDALRQDFDDTFAISLPITEKECKKDKGLSRLYANILKLFAPLF